MLQRVPRKPPASGERALCPSAEVRRYLCKLWLMWAVHVEEICISENTILHININIYIYTFIYLFILSSIYFFYFLIYIDIKRWNLTYIGTSASVERDIY